jgi:hypothetical protein
MNRNKRARTKCKEGSNKLMVSVPMRVLIETAGGIQVHQALALSSSSSSSS